MTDFASIVKYTLYNDDKPSDYLVTPAVAYFCFDSVDFDFEKPVLEEDIFSDVKKEQKALKKKKTSELTGTIYKLSKEQKRALKYLKKKYGKSLVKEIKEYRKNTLAPYQVAKTYMEKSKALYPKEVLGMTKEEYLKYKKSAENKIANMRSNRYEELTREYMSHVDKGRRLDDISNFFRDKDIDESTVNRLFKKYGFYSTRFTDAEMRDYQRKLDKIEELKRKLVRSLATSGEDVDSLKKDIEAAEKEVGEAKKGLSKKEDDTIKSLKELRLISNKIGNSDISPELKSTLHNIIDDAEDDNKKITSKSFEQEYENFLMRQKIRDDIKKRKDTKYTDDYRRMFQDSKEAIEDKKSYTAEKMAKERESKTLNDKEKKIYELKPGMKPDTDRISDYNLKIKEDDFFEPRFYNKSEEFRNAERKIDAEIKRFERALEAKMEEKDFQLLRKYRLISNLVMIKNAKPADLYEKKEGKKQSAEEQEPKEEKPEEEKPEEEKR